MFLLAFLVGFAVVSAEPSQICREAFYKSGLSTNYNETIAHAVHSMSVEGLRLFDPMASEQNKVPTVNQDLSQEQKVLNYAPHFHTSTDFATSTMNMIDKILSTVGNSKDGLGPHWSSVERIAHVFHMWDLWQKVCFNLYSLLRVLNLILVQKFHFLNGTPSIFCRFTRHLGRKYWRVPLRLRHACV